MSECGDLISGARTRAGFSQGEVAERAGTSRTAVCAYENGSKDPRFETVSRIVRSCGLKLVLRPSVKWRSNKASRILPSALPDLEPAAAFAVATLNDNDNPRAFDLGYRPHRLRAYELLLTAGTRAELSAYLDGKLLLDAWTELDLSPEVRSDWQPLIQKAMRY
jgi:transcriptional regulator with XRE-family HTH domain